MRSFTRLAALAILLAPALPAGELDWKALTADLEAAAKGFNGRVGVCVQTLSEGACANSSQRFPMQSVMKLFVGYAVMYAVDTQGWKLDDPVTVRREDLSLYVQPIAQLVGPEGYRTTVGDLVRRAVIESDSAATDILIARLGGPKMVQEILRRKGVDGIRFDRNERDLQTEIVGLKWRPEFVDAEVLNQAIAAVPEATRDAAFAAYQKDYRDTASPFAMTSFLLRLVRGNGLSPETRDFLLQALKDCATFPDRLKAGVPAGWEVWHKTGTSGTWKGVTTATNDVGYLIAPDGTQIMIAVFVADSPASAADRAAIIARMAALTVSHYR